MNQENFCCRICNGKEKSSFLKNITTDLGEHYSLIKCTACGFISVDPLPDKNTLSAYYGKFYWNGEQPDPVTRDPRMKFIANYLRKLYPGKVSLLDWGCGDGAFVNLTADLGFDAKGIDEYSDTKNPKIIKGRIDGLELQGEKFDIITSFHVLEHLYNPVEDLRNAVAMLKEDGLMLIELPNINSISFKIFKKRWQPLQIPEHLNHFTSEVLKSILEDAGLSISKISFFSLRASPAVIPLSIFPYFEPEKIRRIFDGRYPVLIKILYLGLQILFLPLTILESLFRHGAVMCFYCKKGEY